ncbi:ABC transporter permease [Candidatus Bathyarchaeota archaeon]|nr:ABC transporter permease [Candidatus Bathyarchaeota archaeon]
MNLPDIFLISTQGLRERKFRFVLNLVGIFIGCMAVTGLISLTQGLNDLVGDQLEMFGPNNIMVMPGSLEMGAGFIASQNFNWRDIQTIERVSNVETVTPVIGNKLCGFTQKGHTRYGFVYGIEAVYFEIMSGWDVEAGRNLRRGDTAVVVMGHDLAKPKDETLPGYSVGDRITLEVTADGEEREMSFRVIGVMEKMGGIGGMSSDEDQSIFMPLRTCQQLFETGGEFQYVVARVKDTQDVPQVAVDIEKRLGGDVTVMTSESMGEMVGTILGAVEAVLGGVAAISLLVAGVGIINTMTISVMERTKEIGILKAIGSKSSDVLLMFLSEAVVTGLIGGVLGVTVGFMVGNAIGKAIDMPVSSSITLGLGVVVFAMVTTSLSGLYPAWRASRLHPVEALRSE